MNRRHDTVSIDNSATHERVPNATRPTPTAKKYAHNPTSIDANALWCGKQPAVHATRSRGQCATGCHAIRLIGPLANVASHRSLLPHLRLAQLLVVKLDGWVGDVRCTRRHRRSKRPRQRQLGQRPHAADTQPREHGWQGSLPHHVRASGGPVCCCHADSAAEMGVASRCDTCRMLIQG